MRKREAKRMPKVGPIEWLLIKGKWQVKEGTIESAEAHLDSLIESIWQGDDLYRAPLKKIRATIAEAIARGKTGRAEGYRLRPAKSRVMDPKAKERLRALAAQRKAEARVRE